MSIPNALAGRRLWLLGVASLAALLALAAAALGPAQHSALADGHDTLPPNLAFNLNLVNDSDNIVPAGSELTVNAAITYDGSIVGGAVIEAPAADKAAGFSGTDASLRISGSFEWESAQAVGSRLALGAIELASTNGGIDAAADAVAPIDESSSATPKAALGTGIRGQFHAAAWDGRTLIARVLPTTGTVPTVQVYAFDPDTNAFTYQTQVQDTSAGPGRNTGWHERFAASRDDLLSPNLSPIALWEQDDGAAAWLFIGSEGRNHAAASGQLIGGVYIYKVTYNVNGMHSLTLAATLEPPMTEANNRKEAAPLARADYGTGLAVSADGSTLVVSARQMNHMGALYVYTRPTGSGSWGDIEYSDGVKLTPVAVPAWGTGASNRPFTPGAAGTCDAYCRRVTANEQREGSANEDDYILIGQGKIGISADGTVIAAGAPGKQYADDTLANGFSGGVDNGQVFIYVAPSGGWDSVDDVSGTAVAARAAVPTHNSFDPSTHYSPGPAKRVTSATATLRPTASFTSTATDAENFGVNVDVSDDGSTIAVSSGFSRANNIPAGSFVNRNANVYIFERDGDSWSGDITDPTAKYTLHATDRTWAAWGMDLNPAGDTLVFGQRPYSSNIGRAVVIKKGSGWSNATIPTTAITQTATMWQLIQPIFTGTTNANSFGAPLYNVDGDRLLISAPGTHNTGQNTGRIWNWHAPTTGDCAERTYDDVTTTSCTVAVPSDGKVVIPAGSPDGVFTISGSVKLTRGSGDDAPTTTARRSLEVTVGKVQEVASVNLAIPPRLNNLSTSTDDDNPPWPSVLRSNGDSTRIVLSILNSGGTASAAGSVASVLVTSSAGELGIVAGGGNATSSSCSGLSCQIDVSSINAGNAHRIMLSLTHKGRAGNARVSASVQSRETGDALRPDPLEIVLAGPADKITVADPAVGVLNVDQADTDDEGNDVDTVSGYTQDELLLAVSAQDKAGNIVAVPRATGGRAVLKDAEGKSVRTGATATFPARWRAADDLTSGCVTTAIADTTGATVICRDPDVGIIETPENVNPAIVTTAGLYQVKVDVDAAPTSPLKAGTYTVEVTAGGKTASAAFNVSGGAASDGVSLDAPTERVALGETFTVTATVVDADGNPVPDSTSVNWINPQTTSGAGRDTLVVSTTMTDRTKDGKATNTYLVVGSGTVVLRATAGAGSDAAVVNVGGMLAPPTPPNPADFLRSRNPNDLTTWLGQGRTSAAALLNGLEGISFVLLWLNGEWLSYGLADGRMIPGSTDFTVNPGSVLWLSR